MSTAAPAASRPGMRPATRWPGAINKPASPADPGLAGKSRWGELPRPPPVGGTGFPPVHPPLLLTLNFEPRTLNFELLQNPEDFLPGLSQP
jgi:hypothetical protein